MASEVETLQAIAKILTGRRPSVPAGDIYPEVIFQKTLGGTCVTIKYGSDTIISIECIGDPANNAIKQIIWMCHAILELPEIQVIETMES